MAFSPDGEILAASGLGNTVILWSSSGEPLHILRAHLEHVSSLAFSRDGTLLASGARDDSTIRIWDVRTGTLRQTYGGHAQLAAVFFSPDSRRLAVIGAGNVEVMDCDNGRTVLTFPHPQGGPYQTVAFSPDGLKLATAGTDGTVRQWEALPWRTASNTPAQTAPVPSPVAEEHARLASMRDAYWRQRLAESTLPASIEPPPWKPGPSAWPARDPSAAADLIDLSDLYNAPLNLPCALVTSLWQLRAGVTRLDGVPFDIRGIVQLQAPGGGSDSLFPNRVAIPVGRPAARLHFLHATLSSASAGEVVGSYIIHYSDGDQQVIDLTYGRELRICNDTGAAYDPLHRAWVAPGPLHPAWVAPDQSLYHFTWDIPNPERPINNIEFIAQGPAGPLLLALTIDPPQDQLLSRVAALDQQINGKSPTALLLMERARTQMLLGHAGSAIADYDAALQLGQDDDARSEFARALAADQQFEHAEGQYLLLVDRARAYFHDAASWADPAAIEPAVEAFYTKWGQPARAYQIRREFKWLWEKRDRRSQVQRATQVLRFDPDNEAALFDRGVAYASLWQFREVTADFDHLRRINPDNHLYWHQGIPPLLEIGQEDRYRELRGKALRTAAFANSSDWNVPHRIAKDAMFLPLSGQDLKLAMDFADRATDLAGNGFTWQTKGMAEYRAGNFQEAIAWLHRSVADLETTAIAPYIVIPDRLFMAMAYGRLGDRQQARDQLRTAIQLMDTQLPKRDETILFSGNFQDWILCDVVRREADALIGSSTPTTEPTTQHSDNEADGGVLPLRVTR